VCKLLRSVISKPCLFRNRNAFDCQYNMKALAFQPQELGLPGTRNNFDSRNSFHVPDPSHVPPLQGGLFFSGILPGAARFFETLCPGLIYSTASRFLLLAPQAARLNGSDGFVGATPCGCPVIFVGRRGGPPLHFVRDTAYVYRASHGLAPTFYRAGARVRPYILSGGRGGPPLQLAPQATPATRRGEQARPLNEDSRRKRRGFTKIDKRG